MLYTIICRADLKPSAVSQLADRETYLNMGSELPGGRKRHYLLIEATTTFGARSTAAEALEAVGATDYELEVRGRPVAVP
jgi:hypothetical protein